MSPERPRRSLRLRWLLAAVVLLAVAGAAVALADPDGSEHGRRPATAAQTAAGAGASSSASAHRAGAADVALVAANGPCGTATAQTIAAVETHVARRIYDGEAGGSAVAEDVSHIVGSPELLSAVAAGDQPAVYAAVHAIVYTPHWHIVRLRVVKNGRVLADVGGPYIIAPVRGALRQAARKVGSFVMSVQDDVGYVKLVTRFTGVPIDLYGTPRRGFGFVLGTLRPAPPPARRRRDRQGPGRLLSGPRAFGARISKRPAEGGAAVPVACAFAVGAQLPVGDRPDLGQRPRTRRGALFVAALPLPGPVGHPAGRDRRPDVRAHRLPPDRGAERRPAASARRRHGQIPRAHLVGPLVGALPAGADLFPGALLARRARPLRRSLGRLRGPAR